MNRSTAGTLCSKLLCIALFVLFLPSQGSAEVPTVVVDAASTKYQLGPHIQFYQDESRLLTIEEISSPAFSSSFHSHKSMAINEGLTDCPLWIRFAIARTTPGSDDAPGVSRSFLSKTWLLHLGKHLDFFDEIAIYWREADSTGKAVSEWTSHVYGIASAVDRGVRDPLVIALTPPQQDQGALLVYMRIEMVGGLFIEPTLYQPSAYQSFVNKLSVFHGAYYGIVLSMILYNLFHFFFLRDRVRLLFIGYALTFCCYFLVANELSMAIIPTDYLAATRKFAQLLALTIMVQITYFTIAFLDGRQTMPRFNVAMHLIAASAIILILTLPFISYLAMGRIIANFGLLVLAAIMIFSVATWLKGYKPARFFVLSWFFFLGGGLIYALNFRGIFPYPFIGNNALQAGSAIEMILISLAIADRVKFIVERLERSQRRRQEQLNALTSRLVQAEEIERRRIAAILHDSIGQLLFAIKWEVERMLKALDRSQQPDTTVLSYLSACIQETRNLTSELYPRELYQKGLEGALVTLADSFNERYKLEIVVYVCKKSSNINDNLKTILYRTSSELLNNVAKHSQGTLVQVSLETTNGKHILAVEDDGIGFSYPRAENGNSSGFGLFSIVERLGDIGGSLHVEASSLGGARVVVATPVAATV